MITPVLETAIDSAVPAGATHIGLVATDINGRYLVARAKNPLYEVTYTWPEKRLEEGRADSYILAHLAAEALGDYLGETINESLRHPMIGLYPVSGVWGAPNSTGFYFHALVGSSEKAASSDTFDYLWCSQEEASNHFDSSPTTTRNRDQSILTTASQQCASPSRRILLMLRELHRMGFERLRAPAYKSPLAWRCPIVPASWTHRDHGGTFEDPSFHLRELLGETIWHHTYTSASRQQPFGWKDMVFATPKDLALRFIQEKREIAFSGWGPDPDYVAWFEQMLDLTEPNGIITSNLADHGPGVTDYLYAHSCRNEAVSLPPGGTAVAEEFHAWVQRLTNL
jgi:hypothetical protein